MEKNKTKKLSLKLTYKQVGLLLIVISIAQQHIATEKLFFASAELVRIIAEQLPKEKSRKEE